MKLLVSTAEIWFCQEHLKTKHVKIFNSGNVNIRISNVENTASESSFISPGEFFIYKNVNHARRFYACTDRGDSRLLIEFLEVNEDFFRC